MDRLTDIQQRPETLKATCPRSFLCERLSVQLEFNRQRDCAGHRLAAVLARLPLYGYRPDNAKRLGVEKRVDSLDNPEIRHGTVGSYGKAYHDFPFYIFVDASFGISHFFTKISHQSYKSARILGQNFGIFHTLRFLDLTGSFEAVEQLLNVSDGLGRDCILCLQYANCRRKKKHADATDVAKIMRNFVFGYHSFQNLMAKITVQNTEIAVVKYNEEDYISLTDMARSQMQEHIIFRWLSLKSTIEYLGEWEMLYNPDFNCTEFGTIKNAAGSNNFVLSVKTWLERTNSIGIRSKAGRYGGTYAHRDIAYHFGMWISPKFQLLLVKEYQRLKTEEQRLLGWSAKRELSKINYRIHTDAIKQNLIPVEVTPAQASIIYANEADVLNVAMFGVTAKQWREANPSLKGNIRDYATINELICLSNMENINAVFIEQGIAQSERLVKLNQIAIHQMSVLESSDNDRQLLK